MEKFLIWFELDFFQIMLSHGSVPPKCFFQITPLNYSSNSTHLEIEWFKELRAKNSLPA